MYLRMVDWALENDRLSMAASEGGARLDAADHQDIQRFEMADLDLEN